MNSVAMEVTYLSKRALLPPCEQKREDYIAQAAGNPNGEKQKQEDEREQRNPTGYSESGKVEQ